MSIQAAQLVKSFGNRRVLRGLDFNAAEGEIVALIGMNGAGKTTLLRLLSNLMKPDAGEITISGLSLASHSSAVRQKIGVVLHAPMLYPDLTAEENLRFFYKLYNIPENKGDILNLLAQVNLKKRRTDLVRTFSRGMQQRLAIARALVHDPRYLLMDEPYTGLDQDSSTWLDGLLRAYADHGKTILLATHDLERAVSAATRVDILHQGSIVYSCLVSQLSPGQLSETYRLTTIPRMKESQGLE